MDQNEQEESKLKSILQKLYSAFNLICKKLNGVFSAVSNVENTKTTFRNFSKMTDLQNQESNLNFTSRFFQLLNFLITGRTERPGNRGDIPVAKNKEFSNENSVQRSFKDSSVTQNDLSLFEKAIHKIEMNKSPELNAVIAHASEFKGDTLTKDEISMTQRLLEFANPFQMLSKFTGTSASTITNSLTARGGFQGGAVMPNKDNINKQIDSKVEKIKEIMDQIKSLQNEIKSTVEKGLKV